MKIFHEPKKKQAMKQKNIVMDNKRNEQRSALDCRKPQQSCCNSGVASATKSAKRTT